MTRAILLGLTLLSLPGLLPAQGVLVAPHDVIIDHRTRSGSITLYNPGNDPAEVSIDVFFGYPVSDSSGFFMLRTVEQPDSTLPSAAGWIQAFPRRMTIGPQERQTVRLLGRPPADLKDGEYWARLAITAKGGQLPVTGAPDTGSVQVGLSLEVRSLIPVQYRKGALTTGVETSGWRAVRVGDSLEVRGRIVRTGTAAYLGVIRGALTDSTGKPVASFTSPTAIYLEMEPRYTVPVAGLPPGRYVLRVELATDRSDLAPELVLRAPPVRDSLEVRLP
jgi:P pilus assembly chaperone PapD